MASSKVIQLPLSFNKLVCTELTNKFRKAVQKQAVHLTQADVKPTDVIVRNKYVGINASDINITAGRYANTPPPPFDVGLESVGEVVWSGSKCSLSPGSPVILFGQNGTFSEYQVVPGRRVIPAPQLKPEFCAIALSGNTAAISLDNLGDLKAGETVLITAATGGTGQFAVQLAHLAGCHVIGTCSSDEKASVLKNLGCHRPINYNKEDVYQVLKKEYPKGIDVIYESVGGQMFETCVRNLAVKGRLIVIGMITQYQESVFETTSKLPLSQILLFKSASIRGFFLPHYAKELVPSMTKLAQLYSEGKLKVLLDNGESALGGPFVGLDTIPDAVDYLYSKNSKGKIIVEMDTAKSKM